MTIEGLWCDYIAAGFAPDAFWGLTFRTFDLQMRGAQKQIELQIEISNRQAYNTAALSGGAMGGKLPTYEKVFGKHAAQLKAGPKQPAAALEANLRALAIAWGAK